MSDPFIGQVMMFGGTFAPMGWAFCNGQLLSIAQNDVLYSLLGTTYGGDGQTTFGLPDLQGRVPIHRSSAIPLGMKGGQEKVTLQPGNLPSHSHQVMAKNTAGNVTSPASGVWAASTVNQYTAAAPDATMIPQAITTTGGGLQHDNMMPFLAISFCIALEGIYPQQN